MATDTAKAKKQMRQSNQIEERLAPVYCLSDVRRADIHLERVCLLANIRCDAIETWVREFLAWRRDFQTYSK